MSGLAHFEPPRKIARPSLPVRGCLSISNSRPPLHPLRTDECFSPDFTFALTLGFLNRLSGQATPPPPLRGDFDDALLREWVPPEYPAAARQVNLEGEVVVEFVVEADGHVSQATVTKSSDERFNASALAAVQRWVFVSATFEGKPAASAMRASVVVFKLAQLNQKKSPSAQRICELRRCQSRKPGWQPPPRLSIPQELA